MSNYKISIQSSGVDSPPVDMEQLASQLKVWAEPKRLLILHLLMEGIQCNCELGDALDMPPNLISHHLRILREAGLVDMERDQYDARWVYYSVNVKALAKLRKAFCAFFDMGRIKPRHYACGPRTMPEQATDFSFVEE